MALAIVRRRRTLHRDHDRRRVQGYARKRVHRLFRATHLAINILSTDQLDVVGVFATKADDKFAGLDWEPGPFGSPLIKRSGAQMEVEIRERLQASTHTLFVCRVVHATVSHRHPMVYSAGKFFDGGTLTPLA